MKKIFESPAKGSALSTIQQPNQSSISVLPNKQLKKVFGGTTTNANDIIIVDIIEG